LLHQLGPHSARGQRYLPDDVLARHGAQAADLYAGKSTAALQAALAEVRALAEHHLDALRTEGGGVPQRLLPAFLPVSLAPIALAVMERADADPFRPPAVPQWRRQWALWRAARKPARFIKMRRDGPAGNAGRR
jgi:phytoene synthase